MKNILILMTLLVSALTAHAAETKKLTVNGMVCAFCAQGIEKRLSALPQTQAVYVNLDKRVVAVQAKEGQQFDDAVLKHEITEAGYDVVKVEAVAQTVDAIRAEMKSKK
jgi:copper chaperone CopZ